MIKSIYESKDNFCVYRHIKPDGETFYIGMSCNLTRPYDKLKRSRFWKFVYNSYPDYEVQILKQNMTKKDAENLEIALISWYGRRCNHTGQLVNLTDGGESNFGEDNPNYGNNWTTLQKDRMSLIIKHQFENGRKPDMEALERGRKTKIKMWAENPALKDLMSCLLYTSPSPRDRQKSRMPSSA